MNLNSKILSDITIFEKYAKFNKDKGRRENWVEICDRNKEMHISSYPQLASEITKIYTNFVIPKKVLPSMRSLQFGGFPIFLNNSRMFNCAFGPVDHYKFFSEAMFLLLGGTGLGYSVQKHHIDQLPSVVAPIPIKTRYVVGDSIEGWADAINFLVKSYFKEDHYKVDFEYGDIREKGMPLITSGGKAPGPEPLKYCIEKIESILEGSVGRKLKSIEVHDIICHIADSVLAGGIRRAALISLFDKDDEDMLLSKSGNWWENNEQRGRANNSAVLNRNTVTKEEFVNIWKKAELSQAGEPGVYLTNDIEWGTNPCVEIALRAFQFCNLTEINASDLSSEEDFLSRCEAASFLGTLQAGYTDFHYIRPIWRQTTEKDALIGVSMTGIASNKVFEYDLNKAAKVVIETNKKIAQIIGINQAARTTCVKPAGTTSLVLGTSSGIHAWHNDYYIRRFTVLKSSPLYTYLFKKFPYLLEDKIGSEQTVSLLSIPIESPENSTLRHESPFNLLERVKYVSDNWIKSGFVDGKNLHNVSATVNLKDDEWEQAVEWMWENKDSYNGLSVFPYHGGTYKQTPFEDISKEKYEEMVGSVDFTNFNIDHILETFDNTDLKGEMACAGGSCEVV